MGLAMRKPVFGVSDKARLKPVPSAIGTSLKLEILLLSSLDMILSKKRITKSKAGWLAPLLFAHHRRKVFSRRGPNKVRFYAREYVKLFSCECGYVIRTRELDHSNRVTHVLTTILA